MWLKYIDVFNLSVVSKTFHLLCISYRRYKRRLVISKAILGSDINENFNVIMRCLDEIFENIFCGFSVLLKSRQFLKSIINLKMKKNYHDILPPNIYEHLSTCMRGKRDVERCNFCNRFFVENVDEMNIIKYAADLFI